MIKKFKDITKSANTRAFTIAEIMTVMVVLGVVVAFTTIQVSRNRQNEFDTKNNKTISSISSLFSKDLLLKTGKSIYSSNEVKALLNGLAVKEDNCINCWGNNNINGVDLSNTSKILLENESSIAVTQDDENVKIFLDANGAKGPNVLGKDIRLYGMGVTREGGTNKSVNLTECPVCTAAAKPDNNAHYTDSPCNCNWTCSTKSPDSLSNATWDENACKWACNTESANTTYIANSSFTLISGPSETNNCTYEYDNNCKWDEISKDTKYSGKSNIVEEKDTKNCQYVYSCAQGKDNDTYVAEYQDERFIQKQNALGTSSSACKYTYSCNSNFTGNDAYNSDTTTFSKTKNSLAYTGNSSSETDTQLVIDNGACDYKYTYKCKTSTSNKTYNSSYNSNKNVIVSQNKPSSQGDSCAYNYACKIGTDNTTFLSYRHGSNDFEETTPTLENNCRYSYKITNCSAVEDNTAYVIWDWSGGTLKKYLATQYPDLLTKMDEANLPDMDFETSGNSSRYCNTNDEKCRVIAPMERVRAYILDSNGQIIDYIPYSIATSSHLSSNYNFKGTKFEGTSITEKSLGGGVYDLSGTINIHNCTFNVQGRNMDPLVLDINGDGITTKNEMIKYDLNGDGKVETIYDSADAVLCFDRDKDGVCGKDGSELFGDSTRFGFEDENFKGYTDGFDALKALARHEGLISDDDPVLDEQDIKYLEEKWGLRIKKDGYLSEPEKLSDNKITSISTGNGEKHWYENFDDKGNSLMIQEGSTFVIDNKTNIFADIWHKIVDALSGLWESIIGIFQ